MKNIIILFLLLACFFSAGAQQLKNSSGSIIGYIDNGKVKNSSGSIVGYIEDGRVKNSSGSIIGYFDGVRRIEAALYFFFFFY